MEEGEGRQRDRKSKNKQRHKKMKMKSRKLTDKQALKTKEGENTKKIRQRKRRDRTEELIQPPELLQIQEKIYLTPKWTTSLTHIDFFPSFSRFSSSLSLLFLSFSLSQCLLDYVISSSEEKSFAL